MQTSIFDPPEQEPKKHIRILLGGSPCTHWSIAQKKNRETEASGIGWELFRNYLIAKEKFKPDYFLYENNKSAAQPIKDQISKELGVELKYINSALVSAQNRQRFYAHNIPGVPQPEDRGILLKDILDSGEARTEKGYALTTRGQGAIPEDTIQKHRHSMVAEPIDYQPYGELKSGQNGLYCISKDGTTAMGYTVNYIDGKAPTVISGHAAKMKIIEPIRIGTIEHDGGYQHDSKQYRVYLPDGKPTTLCGQGGGVVAKTGLYACPINVNTDNKCKTLTANYYKSSARDAVVDCAGGRTMVVQSATGKEYPVYTVANGLITIKDKQYPIKLPDGYYIIRKLTIKECCRLQTFPDNWFIRQDGTQIVSNSQAYKQLGNSWTVEVSKHILSFIPNISECTVEVLSMYDGISAGQLSLEQLGAKIVSYKATEIDKYCIQTTQYHFPKTVQLGNAFQVREKNWRY